jgi:hypothetical protein
MIIYYIQRIRNKEISKILNESTNKYIENIKKSQKNIAFNNIYRLSNKNKNDTCSNICSSNICTNHINIAFVSVLVLFIGYSCVSFLETSEKINK